MMEKLRCLGCAKVLGEAEIAVGTFKKICPKCKALNSWQFIETTFLMGNEFSVSRRLVQKVVEK